MRELDEKTGALYDRYDVNPALLKNHANELVIDMNAEPPVIDAKVGLAVTLIILFGALLLFGLTRSDTAAMALEKGHYRQAVKFLRQNASDGDIAAITMLGNLHQLGLGVSRRPDTSVRLYSQAAFAGDIAARINLGHAYSRGEGVEKDAFLAYAWYNLARNGGSPVAQEYMSELLADHRLRYNKVAELRLQYATINNFTKLH